MRYVSVQKISSNPTSTFPRVNERTGFGNGTYIPYSKYSLVFAPYSWRMIFLKERLTQVIAWLVIYCGYDPCKFSSMLFNIYGPFKQKLQILYALWDWGGKHIVTCKPTCLRRALWSFATVGHWWYFWKLSNGINSIILCTCVRT